MTARLGGRVLTVILLAAPCTPTHAYLKLGTGLGSEGISLKWRAGTVSYFIANREVPNVSPTDLQNVMARSFSTWTAVPSAEIDFQFAGFTGAIPLEDDDINTIGFLSRPDLERVLATTGFTYDTATGEIIESDIFFNSSFDWSTAEGGQAGRFDLQSIATHEAGHFLGLGHSALGETERQPSGGRRVIAAEAVMFPIAFSSGNTEDRVLRPDDIAGVSDIYPAGDFRQVTGSIQGRITRSGSGVLGAHVVAFNLRTQSLVGNFTLDDDGGFVIAGLEPGLYIVRAEPLDDGELESFFEGIDPADTLFRPRFYDSVVAVPAGGSSQRIEIAVVPR